MLPPQERERTGRTAREVETVKPLIPLKKQSKRQQKEAHSRRRASWGDVVPATRVIPSGKTYRRRDAKALERKAMARKDG